MSFDETVDSRRRTTAASTGKRRIEELVERAARDVEAFYVQRAQDAVRLAEAGSILVLTTDAKSVVMRPERLREPTRRAAKQAASKLRTRLSAGEKANRKRMAQVASVYTIAPHVARPKR